MFVVSRSLSALCAVNMPNARKAGMLCVYTKNIEKKLAVRSLIVVLVISGMITVLSSPVPGSMAILFAILSTLLYRKMAMKQFGGVTGDTSGFFLQMCELSCLIGSWIGGIFA